MCGIAGFISNNSWHADQSHGWLTDILQQIEALSVPENPWEKLGTILKQLLTSFDRMMSFSFHYNLVNNPAQLHQLERLADQLESKLQQLTDYTAEKGRTDELDQLAEDIRDSMWQIRQEVIANIVRTQNIMPPAYRGEQAGKSIHFAAWAIEQVLENIDRLEVRGRDSAGISIQMTIAADKIKKDISKIPAFSESLEAQVKQNLWSFDDTKGNRIITFVFKIANLVGSLGDNTAGLRQALLNNELLWAIADHLQDINIIAHTRWASNGIISLGNCHPTDGTLYGSEDEQTISDRGVQFVLNGDVDNYKELVQSEVLARDCQIDPSVTTDAKILPLFYRLGTDHNSSPSDRFSHVMQHCDGSLAIVMQNPLYPRELFLSQKGSGQSLFIGSIEDGFIMASEVYGLAARTRTSYSLSGTEKGGTVVVIRAADSKIGTLEGRYLDDAKLFEIKPDPIYIHSRDIFRGSYKYYFEKEIFEAPASVRKTIKNKYRKVSGKVEFAANGHESFSRLLSRLRQQSPPIRRIMVIGQGTASIAAMGTCWLIKRALTKSRITVDWSKSSELSGFLTDEPLDDMLLVAISQSGTTTDTNRTVDVAGSQGAWVHSIVNRRNSPLVSKSNSYFYTSDGRDVEMAVASTKAFYSQIAAGKLLSLLLAQEFGTLSPEEIHQELVELEKLPNEIEWVLGIHEKIRDCAEKYGPSSRNWAVVGNGPNKIAADEIRIKLSELCYKSIPCDFTEDKKHIDLSTEPLTLVIANDLPEAIVQDTAKEVAIFKAHNGKPIVMISKGEKRFHEYAEQLMELPSIGAGLGFVLATVAGHLWGFYTARAIDSRADEMRSIRTYLTHVLENSDVWNEAEIRTKLLSALRSIATGESNSSLPASTAAAVALYCNELTADSALSNNSMEKLVAGISLLNKAIEEMTRPIDTIRHQAKTVTVGITRPQEILPPILLDSIQLLDINPLFIKEQDRRLLRLVSTAISQIAGGMFYQTVPVIGEKPWIQAVRKIGLCSGKSSRYDEPKPIGGSKRTALRLERSIWSSGPNGDENLVIIPIVEEATGQPIGIVLFHLQFSENVSTQLKLNILRGLGTRYYELLERLEEVSPGASLEKVLDGISVRDMILAPADRLISRGSPIEATLKLMLNDNV